MWGSLAKNAQALAAIAAEQAQKGLASANQLLEKLDGQLDGEEDGGEEDDDENYNEDGSRKEVIQDDRKVVEQMRSVDSEHVAPPLMISEVDLDETVGDREETFFTPMKQPERKQSQFDMKPEDTLHEADNSIDDEIDDLLFESDNADEVQGPPSSSGEKEPSDTISKKNVLLNTVNIQEIQNDIVDDSQQANNQATALNSQLKVR